MKRIIALLLAVMMVATLFVGCQKKDNGTTEGTTAAATTAKDDTSKETTKATEAEKEIPTIVWYAVGGGKPANYDSWTEKVNAYLEEKIGVHLDYECVSWGDWDDRHNAIVSTNEPYDIMFANGMVYSADVAMGAYADISDLLNEVPGLKETIPEDVWKGCAIDGKVYGVPTYKDCACQQFLVCKKDVADKVPNWQDIHTLQDLDPVLQSVKDLGELPMSMVMNSVFLTYDNLGTGLEPMGVSYEHEGTEAPKVVSVLEQADTMEKLNIIHDWMGKGYINSDAAIQKEPVSDYAIGFAQGWPSAVGSWSANRGADCVCTEFEVPRLSNSDIQGSLSCIANTSKHKVEALKLLELANTDKTFRDMLAYGEEGVNFDYVEEEGMQKVQRNADNPWTFAAYTQATFFTMSTEAGTTGNYWVDEVKGQNERAVVSPAIGFYFNPEKVADAIDACRAIWIEYKPSITTGTADPTVAVPEMMERLRESGFDDIVAEAQAQLDAWWAAQN